MSEPGAAPQMAVSLSDVAPGDWTLDPTTSAVNLRHKTMWGLVTVKGTLSEVHGEGQVAPDGSARGTVSIRSASIDTKNKKRDIHLRSADLLDADTYPSIVYTATAVTPAGDGTVRVEGTLTVRDATRPLNFTAQPSEVSAETVALTAELEIDRNDFGLTWNQMGMMKDITALVLALRFKHRSA